MIFYLFIIYQNIFNKQLIINCFIFNTIDNIFKYFYYFITINCIVIIFN